MRSGSGTSRTTNTTSDSGDQEGSLPPSHSSLSASSSPSQPSGNSPSVPSNSHPPHGPNLSSLNSLSTNHNTQTYSQHSAASALSPIASRMRERDADAMEKYLNRNRSGSSSTTSDTKGSSTSSMGDEVTSPTTPSGATTPRRLRPSASANQLRGTSTDPIINGSHPDVRIRAGTSPGPRTGTIQRLTRSSSTSGSKATLVNTSSSGSHTPIEELNEADEPYVGPPSRFAHFPDPPPKGAPLDEHATPTSGRRLPFNLLTKSSLPISDSPPSGHRRGFSAASVR